MKSTWFKTTMVGHKVWAIDDNGLVCSYLVEGDERALLIDTGTGLSDLLQEVKKCTSLPLTIVNTHGHPDHAGGNFQFPEVYAPVKDLPLMLPSDLNIEVRRQYLQTIVKDRPEMEGQSFDKWCGMEMVADHVIPLLQGQTFDLGGRELEVIEIPGHTSGNVAFLDSKWKYLFAGDMISNAAVLMFLPGSTSVEQYVNSLEKLSLRIDEFDKIFPSHARNKDDPEDKWNSQLPLDTGYLAEFILCGKQILEGKSKGERFRFLPVYGDALQHRFGRTSLVYPCGLNHLLLFNQTIKENGINEEKMGTCFYVISIDGYNGGLRRVFQ